MSHQVHPSFGPFFPDQNQKVLYTFFADETTLYTPVNKLNGMQKQQHQVVLDLIGMFQQCVLLGAESRDHVAIIDEYIKPNWSSLFEWHYGLLEKTGANIIPKENILFVSRDHYYQEATERAKELDKIICCGLSCENAKFTQDSNFLTITQQCHSKNILAKHASDYNIPTPDSLVACKKDLDQSPVQEFFNKHKQNVMLKIMGMGGARNVFQTQSPEACLDILAEFDDDFEFVLQERLDLNEFKEMTADFKITDKACTIDNIRNVLIADDQWVGNHLHSNLKLTEQQKQQLENVATFMREMGYYHPDGYSFGVDFLVKGQELIVTEINARWTGGLAFKQVVRKLKIQNLDCYSIIDVVPVEKIQKLQHFMEKTVYKMDHSVNGFNTVMLGFSPYEQDIENTHSIFVWYMVVGDLKTFVADKNHSLGDDVLPTGNKIAQIVDRYQIEP